MDEIIKIMIQNSSDSSEGMVIKFEEVGNVYNLLLEAFKEYKNYNF